MLLDPCIRQRPARLREHALALGHIDLTNTLTGADDDVHRECVEQFVGQNDADDSLRQRFRRRDAFAFHCEPFPLRPRSRRAPIDEGDVQMFCEIRMIPRHGIENVACEAAVAGARLDQLEPIRTRRLQDVPHVGKVHRDHLAEERTDIDAGEEVARPPRSSWCRGVVAQLGVVQGKVHERGNGHRPVSAEVGQN